MVLVTTNNIVKVNKQVFLCCSKGDEQNFANGCDSKLSFNRFFIEKSQLHTRDFSGGLQANSCIVLMHKN